MILNERWTVGPLIPRNPQATGGNFCQCYGVRSVEGKNAFLKALDFGLTFAGGTEAIERITTLFNFEKELLGECTRRNMDRVVRAIDSGSITDPQNPLALVPYLIFEKADADIRIYLDDPTATSSLAWKLRSIHHIATGLK